MSAEKNKKLTVSYQAFSCTLEGFDDPLKTMSAIIDCFQNVSAKKNGLFAPRTVMENGLVVSAAESPSDIDLSEKCSTLPIGYENNQTPWQEREYTEQKEEVKAGVETQQIKPETPPNATGIRAQKLLRTTSPASEEEINRIVQKNDEKMQEADNLHRHSVITHLRNAIAVVRESEEDVGLQKRNTSSSITQETQKRNPPRLSPLVLSTSQQVATGSVANNTRSVPHDGFGWTWFRRLKREVGNISGS